LVFCNENLHERSAYFKAFFSENLRSIEQELFGDLALDQATEHAFTVLCDALTMTMQASWPV